MPLFIYLLSTQAWLHDNNLNFEFMNKSKIPKAIIMLGITMAHKSSIHCAWKPSESNTPHGVLRIITDVECGYGSSFLREVLEGDISQVRIGYIVQPPSGNSRNRKWSTST